MIYIKILGTFFIVMISFVLIVRKDLAWARGLSLDWLRPYMPAERSEQWDRRTTALGLLIFGFCAAVLLTLPFGMGVIILMLYLPFLIWYFS